MKIPDKLKAALRTALWSFIALFAMSSLGWLQQVAEWASSSGKTPMPGLSVLGYAAVSAVVAAGIGLVNFAGVWAQGQGILPGSPPSYSAGISTEPNAEGGVIDLALVLIVACVASAVFLGVVAVALTLLGLLAAFARGRSRTL